MCDVTTIANEARTKIIVFYKSTNIAYESTSVAISMGGREVEPPNPPPLPTPLTPIKHSRGFLKTSVWPKPIFHCEENFKIPPFIAPRNCNAQLFIKVSISETIF